MGNRLHRNNKKVNQDLVYTNNQVLEIQRKGKEEIFVLIGKHIFGNINDSTYFGNREIRNTERKIRKERYGKKDTERKDTERTRVF